MKEKKINAVIVETHAESIIIRFNRPEIRSPLSVFVLEKLNEILDEIDDQTQIQNIIFTGTKEVFASGADLREIARLKGETARAFARYGQNLMNKIAGKKQKTIAAINGYCFGGALDLALSCDERIASQNAVFSHPGANLGIITGWGGTQRLPQIVGEARALEIFMTAKRISANEALKIGLIDKIVEMDFKSFFAEGG